MIPVFKWSGEYYGFFKGGNLFDSSGRYVGWLKVDGKVWFADGIFMGELVDDNYILKQVNDIPPLPKLPNLPPIPPIPAIPNMNRIGRLPGVGWSDALGGD